MSSQTGKIKRSKLEVKELLETMKQENIRLNEMKELAEKARRDVIRQERTIQEIVLILSNTEVDDTVYGGVDKSADISAFLNASNIGKDVLDLMGGSVEQFAEAVKVPAPDPAPAKKRGPGRPRGSKNKKTVAKEQLAEADRNRSNLVGGDCSSVESIERRQPFDNPNKRAREDSEASYDSEDSNASSLSDVRVPPNNATKAGATQPHQPQADQSANLEDLSRTPIPEGEDEGEKEGEKDGDVSVIESDPLNSSGMINDPEKN